MTRSHTGRLPKRHQHGKRSTRRTRKRGQRFELSDELWAAMEPLIPAPKAAPGSRGRPPIPPRVIADAIFFVLRTGCQWRSLDNKGFGCQGSTAHHHFQKWAQKGVFEAFWKKGLLTYDKVKGIRWDFQSVDGAMTKAPLGGALRDRTRRTGPRRAPSARYKRTPLASRSGLPSTGQTATT